MTLNKLIMPAVILVMIAGGILSTREVEAADMPNTISKPLVVGHRGCAGLFPENTLAGFQHACELGVDALELDILVSADGQLVVHHDFNLKPEIERSADGRWVSPEPKVPIYSLDLAQLKLYDVGRLKPYTSYSAKYPEQRPVDGERIPTFSEVIYLFRKSCSLKTRLFVEIKTSPEEPDLTPAPEVVADRVVEMIRREGLSERTWILSFDWRNLVHIQKTAPELPTVYLTIDVRNFNTVRSGRPGPSPWMAGFDVDQFGGSVPQTVKAAGGRIWSPYYRNLTPELREEARQLGLLVSVWTPDNSRQLEQVLDLKVDAITTNRPDLLLNLLQDR